MHQSSPTITNSHLTVSSNKNPPVKQELKNPKHEQTKKRSSNIIYFTTHKHRTGETVKKERKETTRRERERKKMRILNRSVVSAFLLSAAAMTNAFTPINIIQHTNINKNSARISSSSSSNSCIVLSSSSTEEQQPCDMPSDMEEIDGTLKNSKALRNAIVTNVDGEQIALGDMLGLEKDKPMTSVVVFLRHMG